MAADQSIIDGIARTLFVDSWANSEAEAGRAYPGEDLMDVAPETTPEAYDAAKLVVQETERINKRPLVAPEGTDPYEFGFYIAMEILGHGVAWTDDHEPHGYKMPYTKMHWELEPQGLYEIGHAQPVTSNLKKAILCMQGTVVLRATYIKWNQVEDEVWVGFPSPIEGQNLLWSDDFDFRVDGRKNGYRVEMRTVPTYRGVRQTLFRSGPWEAIDNGTPFDTEKEAKQWASEWLDAAREQGGSSIEKEEGKENA